MLERSAFMATSVMRVRIDNDLRAKATAVYDELGIDLPTAIRMFLKRSVAVNGIPFPIMLPKRKYRADWAILAMRSLSEAAQQNGTADMSLDEINAEIAESRADRVMRRLIGLKKGERIVSTN